MQRCKNCNEIIAPFPVKNQPEKSLIDNLKEGTINWKNVFRIDIVSLVFIIAILLMVQGYKMGMEEARNFEADPCEYCSQLTCLIESEEVYIFDESNITMGLNFGNS